jgi:uncharacterized protein
MNTYALKDAGAPAAAQMEFLARHAFGEKVVGEALVAHDGFSARYDLDRINGKFSRPSHKLAGQTYTGKILVLDTAKGGVASAWMLHEMASRKMVPLAILFNTVNPILVQGAALAGMTMLAGFSMDITSVIPHLSTIELDPRSKLVRIVKRAQT